MLEIGTILQNRYEIIEPIGQGGMGAVYLARDHRLGNTVALKETFFSETALLAAFEREARLLAGLRHAALPKVTDHFADDHGRFLAMEYIPGDDLHDLIEDSGPAALDEVLQWADQLLDALDYLHSQDTPIIHRDIKPQNLKLTSRNQVVLLDFGLAKGRPVKTTQSTSNSSIFGYTPCYAPLEQVQGSGTDARSDIYSLAATLYHLLTGTMPVDVLTRAACVLNGQPDPLPSASETNSHIPIRVSDILMRGMALNKNQRIASAAEMREMLRDCARHAGEGTAAKAPSAFLPTEIGSPNVIPGGPTHVFASAPAIPVRSPDSTGDHTTRASAPNVVRNNPAPLNERSLYRPRSGAAAQRRTPAVELAAAGESSFRKMIPAGVVLIAAIAIVAFIFTRGANRNEATNAPAPAQKDEATAEAGKSYESTQRVAEPSRVSDQTDQPGTSSRPSPGAEQRTGSDDATQTDNPASKDQETETAQEARQEEPRRGRTPSLQEPEGQKPIPRPVEEEVRGEPVRQERPRHMEPPPPHELPPPHRFPPPPGAPPPGDMPPPGRRRP